MAELAGKSAIVTGATRGIGLSIARALAAEGAAVVVSARTAAGVEQTAAELRATGARVLGITADVRRPDNCERIVASAVAEFGRLDILINNAGVGRFAPAHELTLEDWHTVIDTNLNGVFYCCRAAIPHLRRDGGWIINIGSLAGKNPFAGGAAYNASKFALIGFSEALMQDVRYDNIRVSHVMPGSVATEFAGRTSAEGAEWRLLPEDVAAVVMDLLRFPARALPSCVEVRPSRPRKT